MASLAWSPDQQRIIDLLEERLSPKKLQHALSVTGYLVSFGAGLGLPEEALKNAGLLHDLCRAMNSDELLAKAEAYGVMVDTFSAKRPILLHGPLAAEEGRRELGIDDPAVYEAVWWHTTGTPRLGLLGRALMVADFSEPFRKYAEAAETREILASEGFDAALRHMAQSKLRFAERKREPHPHAKRFHDWVMEGCPENARAT